MVVPVRLRQYHKSQCYQPAHWRHNIMRMHKKVKIDYARQVLTDEMTINGVVVPLLTKKTRSDSGTGHKGVSKRVRRGLTRYEVSITIKGKRIYLGAYKNIKEAIAARKAAEIEYFDPYIQALNAKKPPLD